MQISSPNFMESSYKGVDIYVVYINEPNIRPKKIFRLGKMSDACTEFGLRKTDKNGLVVEEIIIPLWNLRTVKNTDIRTQIRDIINISKCESDTKNCYVFICSFRTEENILCTEHGLIVSDKEYNEVFYL